MGKKRTTQELGLPFRTSTDHAGSDNGDVAEYCVLVRSTGEEGWSHHHQQQRARAVQGYGFHCSLGASRYSHLLPEVGVDSLHHSGRMHLSHVAIVIFRLPLLSSPISPRSVGRQCAVGADLFSILSFRDPNPSSRPELFIRSHIPGHFPGGVGCVSVWERDRSVIGGEERIVSPASAQKEKKRGRKGNVR